MPRMSLSGGESEGDLASKVRRYRDKRSENEASGRGFGEEGKLLKEKLEGGP